MGQAAVTGPAIPLGGVCNLVLAVTDTCHFRSITTQNHYHLCNHGPIGLFITSSHLEPLYRELLQGRESSVNYCNCRTRTYTIIITA